MPLGKAGEDILSTGLPLPLAWRPVLRVRVLPCPGRKEVRTSSSKQEEVYHTATQFITSGLVISLTSLPLYLVAVTLETIVLLSPRFFSPEYYSFWNNLILSQR